MNRPVPTRLKILRGNPGKRPINTAEPKPQIKMPPCPDHLNDDGRKEWRRVGRILVDCGVLTDLDRAAFSTYCTAWQRHVEAERELAKHGTIIRSPKGFPVQSPYLSISNRAMEQVDQVAAAFGLTPSSRSRIVSAKPAESDNAKKFFGDIPIRRS